LNLAFATSSSHYFYIGTAMMLDLTLFLHQDANEERTTKSSFMPQPSSKHTNTWSRTLAGSSIATENVQQHQSGTAAIARPSTTGGIPLPSSHVHRTQSEVQLSLDQEAAERRDTSMFYRLVNGIRERQHHHVISSHDSSTTSEHLESVQSITGILHTRLADIADAPPTNDEDTESHQGLTEVASSDEVSGGADGWSITGYMSSQHHSHNPTSAAATATMATEAVDKQVDDDDCIFDLDF
jgi:hypothetical protein